MTRLQVLFYMIWFLIYFDFELTEIMMGAILNLRKCCIFQLFIYAVTTYKRIFRHMMKDFNFWQLLIYFFFQLSDTLYSAVSKYCMTAFWLLFLIEIVIFLSKISVKLFSIHIYFLFVSCISIILYSAFIIFLLCNFNQPVMMNVQEYFLKNSLIWN